MIEFVCEEYKFWIAVGEDPSFYSWLIEKAALHDDIRWHDWRDAQAEWMVIIVWNMSSGEADSGPDLVVSQICDPPPSSSGFSSGVCLVPETHLLLIGAGDRLLAYDLQEGRRLWEEVMGIPFSGWSRYGDLVLMIGELDFAAFDLTGKKLWTTRVESHSWTYRIQGGLVELEANGKVSTFSLSSGPESV